PRWTPPAVPEDRIRRALDLVSPTPIVLCHGGFSPARGLVETADAMLLPGLEPAHLVFLGYRAVFIEDVLARPELAGRVHFLPAVPPEDVPAWVAGADVDVMAILPIDLNSRLSTPNKLFESLAAGVPVVSTDLPERRRIVLEDPLGPLGALCDPARPASIAAAIRSILEAPRGERDALRARCLEAAQARWNWETESRGFIELYADLGSPSRADPTSSTDVRPEAIG
ncbi:MAG TPA: glycosyltransferase, partial [Candidatus Limnocylindrales bacterium]|nr:glycosyltransferase [Candidatus Limnocylindrales bacterium]